MDEDEYIESDDLLYSQTYGIRMFYTGGLHQEMMVGVILEETDDSFLVALPAIAAVDGDKVMLEELPKASPYHRFMKSGFRMVSFATKILQNAYIKYLRSASVDIFPELLEMIGESEEGPAISIAGDQQQSSVSSSPITETELKGKIKEALENGSLLPQQSDKPS